jgi:hypothetical protein
LAGHDGYEAMRKMRVERGAGEGENGGREERRWTRAQEGCEFAS